MNKNVFVLLLLLALSFIFIAGCTNSIENEQMIKDVIEFEKNEYLIKTLKITFNEYSQNAIALLSSNSGFLDKYNSKELNIKIKNLQNTTPINIDEISNINNEELKKIREKYENKVNEIPLEYTSTLESIEISKVYENESLGTKTIFVKQLEKAYLPEFNFMHYRRYIFRKENDKWKISEIRPSTIIGYGNKGKEHSLSSKKELFLFEEYNGEKVIYDTILSIDDITKD